MSDPTRADAGHLGPWANPMAGNPLRTKADLRRAVLDLVDPVAARLSPGGARAKLGTFAAAFPMRVAELEGWARPLWGIVPLVAGGGEFAHWDRWREGLVHGTDPEGDEYWGPCAVAVDQRMVEMAAVGFALAFVPEHLWDPLTDDEQHHVVEWLRGVERFDPAPNNWQFFRLLVQMGLERVGVDIDRAAQQESLDLLESYHRGDGWYVDGITDNIDYYVPFAFHTYGLLLAASGVGDRAHAERWVERAHRFAPDFRHWFAADGAAFPFGRSQTYRFAQGSFWGALALADEAALPWGEVKGLALRHLRWWSERPISDRDGVLTVGYGYDGRRMCESYNSAGSPYWCMKAFLMLAAPDDHPFWTTEEVDAAPAGRPVTVEQAGLALGRDDDQVVAFFGRRSPGWSMFEQTAAKYRKFAYSSRYGFSGDFPAMFGDAVTDSMLAVLDAATGERRVRDEIVAADVSGGIVVTRWEPFPDVRIETAVAAGAPWHVRVHRIETGRSLRAIETGFAVPSEPEGFGVDPDTAVAGVAHAPAPIASSTLVSLGDGAGERTGTVRTLPPNANLIAPHTIVPVLTSTLEPGTHVLACAAGASPDARAVAPDVAPGLSEALVEALDRLATRD